MSRPHRIDVHHHLVPLDYTALLREKGVQPGGSPRGSGSSPR